MVRIILLKEEHSIAHQPYLTKSSALTKVADANSLASSHTQTYNK
jgi:hypothetical protein